MTLVRRVSRLRKRLPAPCHPCLGRQILRHINAGRELSEPQHRSRNAGLPGRAAGGFGEATVGEVVGLMRAQRGSCVLICSAGDCEGRVEGIFTERDALRWMAEGGSPQTNIREVMTARPAVLEAKAPWARRSKRCPQGGYRHLPIVDEAGVPIGIAAVRGIVHYLVDHFPADHLHVAAGTGENLCRPGGGLSHAACEWSLSDADRPQRPVDRQTRSKRITLPASLNQAVRGFDRSVATSTNVPESAPTKLGRG